MDLNICHRLYKHCYLQEAIILFHNFFFQFIRAPKCLEFWTSSNTCPFVIRFCSEIVIFLFVFVYFVLLSFITNPVLTAACLIGVTIPSVPFVLSKYQHVICICCILSRSVKNCFIQLGLYIPYHNHLLRYGIEQCCRQCVTLTEAFFHARCFGQLTLNFHFSIWILHNFY